jgi:hypothetical protein
MADNHKNFSISAVATAPSPATSGTSLVVTGGHGTRFPAVPFNATICPANTTPDPSNAEIVRVTGISTDTFTIARAQESTTARTVIVGDVIFAGPTAKTLTDVEEEVLGYACSDETTAITAGTGKVTFRMPFAMTLTGVKAEVTTAPTGATIIIDINEAGTSVLSTKLSIDASEKTSSTAASAAVISDSALANDAEMTIDFDQVGSTIAGAGVKVYLIGKRS